MEKQNSSIDSDGLRGKMRALSVESFSKENNMQYKTSVQCRFGESVIHATFHTWRDNQGRFEYDFIEFDHFNGGEVGGSDLQFYGDCLEWGGTKIALTDEQRDAIIRELVGNIPTEEIEAAHEVQHE